LGKRWKEGSRSNISWHETSRLNNTWIRKKQARKELEKFPATFAREALRSK